MNVSHDHQPASSKRDPTPSPTSSLGTAQLGLLPLSLGRVRPDRKQTGVCSGEGEHPEANRMGGGESHRSNVLTVAEVLSPHGVIPDPPGQQIQPARPTGAQLLEAGQGLRGLLPLSRVAEAGMGDA